MMNRFKIIWIAGFILYFQGIATDKAFCQSKDVVLSTSSTSQAGDSHLLIINNATDSFSDQDSVHATHTPRKIFYQGKFLGGVGFGSTHSASVGIDIVNSISFYDVAAVGIGAGLRLPVELKFVVAPVYLDFRLILSQNDVAPMVEAGWGGTFQSNHNYEYIGQILIVQAGVKIKGKQNLSYIVAVGYEGYDILKPGQIKTSLSQNYSSSYTSKATKETIKSFTLNFALVF